MSDVFLSYAREDRETAERAALALEARGWSVWWDPGIRRDVGARQLAGAGSLLPELSFLADEPEGREVLDFLEVELGSSIAE